MPGFDFEIILKKIQGISTDLPKQFICKMCDSQFSTPQEKCNVCKVKTVVPLQEWLQSWHSKLLVKLKEEYPSIDSVPEDLRKTALKNLEDPELLVKIKDELDKRHVGDDLEKMFAYLMTRTAYLPNPKDRKSIALKGDASVGKDNLMNMILDFTPETEGLKVTSATKATLEDDIKQYKIFAISEVNKDQKGGANQDIVEPVKQLAEGGIISLKKDLKHGFKNTLKSKVEQKTVIYSTTEERIDQQLDTRFCVVTIKSNTERITKVNDRTLATVSDLEKTIKETEPFTHHWLNLAHDLLEPCEVVFPFLDGQKAEDLFDCSNPRSQRDLKRLIALAKAIALFQQYQRAKFVWNGHPIILGAPVDFLNALAIGSDFFDLSYIGVDARAKEIYDYMASFTDKKEFLKNELREHSQISRNTLNKRLRVLDEINLIVINEPKVKGGPKYITLSQTLVKPWSKASQILNLKEKLVAFDIKNWLNKYNSISPIDGGIDQVLTRYCTTLSIPLYEVKRELGQKKIENTSSQQKLGLENDKGSIFPQDFD